MRRKIIRSLIIIAALIIAVKALTTGIALFNLYRASQDTLAALSDPTQSGTFADSAQWLGGSVSQAAAELRPFVPLVGVFGSEGCASAQFIQLANALAPVVEAVSGAAGEFYEGLPSGSLPVTDVRAALARDWSASRAQLTALSEVSCGGEGRLSLLWEDARSSLFAVNFALSLPWENVLADGAHWLILLNNSDEIRATGGFTTAVLDLRIQDGHVTFDLLNSYDVDDPERLYYHPYPPRPMQQFMAIHRWMFRDANWSPDYPTSARFASQLFTLNHPGETLDGIITVNMSGLLTLLEYMPPLQRDGAALPPETILNELRAAWNEAAPAQNSDASDRKDFILDFAMSTVSNMRNQYGITDWLKIGAALRAMLERRDILIYAADPNLQAAVQAWGWTGEMREAPADYLMIVETNLGYNKATSRIARTAEYAITLGDAPTARLTLTFTNENVDSVGCDVVHLNWVRDPEADDPIPSYFDRMTACYWNYARVFFPAGSVVSAFDAADIPENSFVYSPAPHIAQIDAWEEGGYSGVGAMLVIPPGETRTFSVDYALPPTVITRLPDGSTQYRLLIQHQPGLLNERVRVLVMLPPNAQVIASSAAYTVTESGEIAVEALLTRDWELTLGYTGD